MKLYAGRLSLFSRKVEIALAEKGIAVEREFVAFTQERGYAPKHPAVLAHNPKRQVPVLVDGDLALFDSTVIFEYLEELCPQPPLYPVTPKERARCRLLEVDADEILFAPVRQLLFRTEPPAADPGVHAGRVASAAEAEAAIAARFADLDARLAGADFFCGSLSVADIALFMTVLFTQRLSGPPLDPHPQLAAWYRRLLARPAFARVAAEIAEADRELSPALSAAPSAG
ncbi:glutathione S-transferase family protein [Dongia rigui]|uniref:Glutathione S-transferase family protein n=1 Tax=Dongia rigui TaxID=940149 RepID=A0ABU5DYD4_9PROT|nr:glutathione S-transferase family protein [Dongia rigui]MDY0872342.1 glutathione S-transferase family protein [Dongia rigui]